MGPGTAGSCPMFTRFSGHFHRPIRDIFSVLPDKDQGHEHHESDFRPRTAINIGARAGPIWHYVALRGTTWHKINPYM